MSTIKLQNADKILDRLKKAYNMNRDVELAHLFDVAPTTVATWRTRNSLNESLIIEKCVDLNLNWVFYGRGPKFQADLVERDPSQVNELANTYNSNSSDLKEEASRFVHIIEHLPWPVKTRRSILESYLRIINEEINSKK